MSLHYLLDGYNIVHQAPALAQGSLQDRREALVRWIKVCRPHGSARNHVTIVFDGNSQYTAGDTGGEVRVMFSQGQNADDCIKGIVERCGNPKVLVVVSDDKGIALYVRALGSGILSVKEFAGQLFNASKQSNDGMGADINKKISLAQADKINKEFERRWIK